MSRRGQRRPFQSLLKILLMERSLISGISDPTLWTSFLSELRSESLIKLNIGALIKVVQIEYNHPTYSSQNPFIISMGCGCLGPKKQKEEVHVTIITDIHLESKEIASSHNLDLFQAIKEKLARKGLLRKLTDNLSSHRNRIPEAMSYNFRVINLNKNIESLYAGIITAQAILDLVYHNFTQGLLEQQPDDFISNTLSGTSKEQQLMGQNNMIKNEGITQKRSPKKSMKMSKAQLYPQVNTSFDEQYFKFILFLFEKDFRVHHRLLNSLNKFCKMHVGLIRCENQVWKVIDKLRNNIQKKTMLQQTCQVFSNLLNLIRDRTHEELRNQKTLCALFRIWLNEEEKPTSSSLVENCEEIIRIHFNRCISSWDSEFLYEAIFRIYDDSQFDAKISGLLGCLIRKTLQRIDIKQSFLRGEFNYLLGYLSVTQRGSMQKKWFAISFNLNYEKMRNQYKNMLKQKVKVQGFRLLNKIIADQSFNIDEILFYNSRALILAFTCNIISTDSTKSTVEIITDQFFKLLKKMTPSTRQILRMRVLQEFKECKGSKDEQFALLKIFKEILFRNSQPIEMDALQNYLIPMKQYKSIEIRLQIMRLVGFIFQNIPDQQIRLTTLGKYKLCEYTYNIYESIMEPSQGLYERYQFTCSAISCLKIISGKYDKSFILALLQRLANAVDRNSMKDSVDTEYCVHFLAFQLRSIMAKSLKLPSGLTRINLSINTESNEEQIRTKMQDYLQEKEQLNFNDIVVHSIFSLQEFEEISNIFKQLFEDLKLQEIEFPTKNFESIHSLRRSGSIKMDSGNVSPQNKSFEQVLDIVHG